MTDLAEPSAHGRLRAGQPYAETVNLHGNAALRIAFENAPIGHVVSDIAFVVTSVNERLAEMLGYQPAEMIGRPVREFIPPSGRSEVRAASLALLTRQDDSIELATRRLLHRDGHEVPASVTSAPVRDEHGNPCGWASLVLDLSQEEQARADLEAAHLKTVEATERVQLLQAVATAANDADTVQDLAPTVLELVCAHFGWDAGCLVRAHETGDGDRIVEVVHTSGDHTPLVEAYRRAPCAEIGTVRIENGPAGRVIVAPLTAAWPHRCVWLFPAGPACLTDEQVEVLGMTALETARVVERESAAERMRGSESRFRSVFGASPLPMGLTIGDSGTYAAVNDALCALVGRSADELVGRSVTEICHPDDIPLADPAGAAAAAASDRRHRFEMRLLHSSGGVIITEITLAWIDGVDGTPQLLAQIQDITARRTVEQTLQHQASHDALTGLANRAQLNRALASIAESGESCVVLFVDIDGFKLINDTRGHDVGDEVLVGVARRLRGAVRPGDLVARFGGDEFVVVCPLEDDTHTSELAPLMAARLEGALATSLETTTGPAEITASIGIAQGTVDRVHPKRLLQRADAAMYQAKQLGKDRHAIYDARLHRRSLERIRTEAALRTALMDDRFAVHFQPIIDLGDRSVKGFEALVRLVDEHGALVPPGDFISVAEQSGLIVPMGTWVLRQSCATLARLRRRTRRPLTVSVNLAARQAARDDLSDVVLAALNDVGLPATALSLELTESALLEAAGDTLDQLNLLHERGVGIALDDFGTGYSSLTYLQQLPVSHLKIDRSFVSEMVDTRGARAIVRSVARLAQELDLGWIAEGIETGDQLDALREIGPGLGQGYLFSRPVPASDLPRVLAAFPGVRPSAIGA